ncbi:MAG: amidase [Gammaproteobacteria bacterium]|nr:amidase [Gammaproteobacteria bacterium]
MELWRLSLAEQSALVANGEISPTELTDAALARIEDFDPALDACVTVMTNAARASAAVATTEIAAGRGLGPLHGLPIGLKDIFDTAGTLTSGCSKTAIDRIPTRDATSVAKLRAAGAIPLAKLTTAEFAHGSPSFDLPWPPARNPWNRDHFTGGSSSGSGAAVAAGYVAAAMGSDTGGSIRGPAAFCGVAGFMPTYGLVSRAGVIPNSFTFDHAGPLAWTARDCALMLDAIAGPDDTDPASAHASPPRAVAGLGQSVRGLRVGLLRHFWEEDLSVAPETIAATLATAEALSGLGAVVEEARIAPVQDWYDVKIVIAESELFNVHRRNLMTRPLDFGQDFLARSLGALLFTGQDYVAAQRRRRQLLTQMQSVWRRFDILLAPSATGPAPRLDAHKTKTFWTKPSILTPFDVTAGPALSLCSGFSATGLPLGIQLVGRPFDDARVLAVGSALEHEISDRSRRPELRPGPPPIEDVPVLGPPDIHLAPGEAEQLEAIAAAARFPLDDFLFGLLAEAAPHAWAMGRRLDQDYGFDDEPSNVFVHHR